MSQEVLCTMSRTVLVWTVYRRTSAEASTTLFASGSDPLAPQESPVEKLMEVITRFTGQTVIPEEAEPGHWVWYGDHGPSDSAWVIFGEAQVFPDLLPRED